MNKSDFINILAKELSYSKEKCLDINNILEQHFFIYPKNKEVIIEEMTQKLNINSKEASHIYDTALKIIHDEIKYKLKHPFKSKNKF